MRNDLLRIGFPEEFDSASDVRIRNIWPIFTETTVRQPPYFVSTDALFEDAMGFYVWRAKGLSRDQVGGDFGPRVDVEKVHIVPGERRISFPGVAILREITDLGEIDPESDMVVGTLQQADGALLDAEEAARRLDAKGYVYFVRDRWNLRPGDIVQVELQGADMSEGYYVPMNAVSQQQDGAYVFVVPEGGSVSSVTKVQVNAVPVAERPEFVLIAPVGEGTLTEGAQIVAKGVHYLVDGESVRVVSTIEAGQ
jgi:hypothetical protein